MAHDRGPAKSELQESAADRARPRRARRRFVDDPSLVQACLAGERRAWNQLVERYGGLVYTTAVRCGLQPVDAAAIVQTVFIVVFRRLPTFQAQPHLGAALIAITARECWRSGKLPAGRAALSDSIERSGSPPHEQVERWEQQHLVRLAFEQLDAPSREALQAALADEAPRLAPDEARAVAHGLAELEEFLAAMRVRLQSGS